MLVVLVAWAFSRFSGVNCSAASFCRSSAQSIGAPFPRPVEQDANGCDGVGVGGDEVREGGQVVLGLDLAPQAVAQQRVELTVSSVL